MDYENLISALRAGNVPSEDIESFAIGREKELKEFESILNKLENSDKSMIKFIDGDFGLGKTFFLKLVEEKAFKKNFVVSKIILNNTVSMNKIDLIYRSISKNLRCKTGTSLDHIINKWITLLKVDASEEYPDDIQKQKRYIEDEIDDCLKETSEHAFSFATAIKYFYRLSNDGNFEDANAALAWLRGEEKIPASVKKLFNVKGKIEKEDALNFLEALSIFIKSIGYSGLVVLFDEAESTMKLTRKDSRDASYNYMREIYDRCSENDFRGTLFIFAGTSRFFTDKNRGAPSYPALEERIEKALPNSVSLKQPIILLSGFNEQNLNDISSKIIENHEKAYNWDAYSKINNSIPDIIKLYVEQSMLTKGIVRPRPYIKALVDCLDNIHQTPNEYKTKDSIIQLFIDKEDNEDFDDDDW